MSASGAVLLPAGGARPRSVRQPLQAGGGVVKLTSFAALGFYGTLRWGVLLAPAPTWRLLGLFAIAAGLAAGGHLVARRSRGAVFALAALAAVLMLADAGIPLTWIRHVRIAVTVSGLSEGISALPGALVPYTGVNEWLRLVIVLGAGALLLEAALLLALVPRDAGEVRRGCSALPLIALAVVPSTLLRPQLAYLHGMVLFLLLAGFLWGEHLRRQQAAVALGLMLAAGAAAMVAAPALDRHRPWLNYQTLASQLAPRHPETFDWTQRYGPLHWPRRGRSVLEIQATRPDYWKAENLDGFDGFGWADTPVSDAGARATIAPGNLRRWGQTLHVTLRAIRTSNVIAAGMAAAPAHLPGAAPGFSDGTWVDPRGLRPGDAYDISVYDPEPSAAQLAAAGTAYPPALIPAYVSVMIPQPLPPGELPAGANTAAPPPMVPVAVAPFGSSAAVDPIAGQPAYTGLTTDPWAVLVRSPYARTYALAQRLAAGAATPYAYVLRVKQYLSHGYRYDEHPPVSRYPLPSFLLRSHRGYCQQFAGAMALLLRLGGVPARVVAGFTPGSYDSATRSWVVSDLNAHAWVEVWFPRIGWVRFDPTPAAAPARGGHLPQPALNASAAHHAAGPAHGSHNRDAGTVTVPRAARQHRGGGAGPLAAVLAAGLALLLAGAAGTLRLRRPTPESMLSELERALARCGRPLAPATTLAGLEQRFRGSPEAVQYLRAIRLARFAGAGPAGTPPGRRALRRALRSGLGRSGALVVLWALPPRVVLPAVWRRRERGIH